ncbi:retron St85 family effector protein [Hydrogenophaga sp.]|uniref:retron St85 family effector protein n=1 Tax=Hydrogenophaga sp. TaxID=1904254 RepID=UPI002FC7B1DA
MRTFLHEKSAIGIRLKNFGLALVAGPPSLLRERQLIFLCGANQAPEKPSARRVELKKFIEKVSSSSNVIYAEGIFNELRKYGKQKNALDLEHRISEVADKVIIILESESAFCELGAFAHNDLRKKLIVINNKRFQKSESFINVGPIAALEEAKSPVIWYPMSPDGKELVDGIGATFAEIAEAIKPKSPISKAITPSELASMGMTKLWLYFVHDIVLFAGPVSHEEIIEILKVIFPETKSFDPVKNLLGVLRESRLIASKPSTAKTWVYSASSTDFFLKYSADAYALMSAFRTHHLRTNPERLIHD